MVFLYFAWIRHQQLTRALLTTTSYPATYDNRLRESSPSSVLSTTAYVDLGKSTSISRDVMMFDLSDYETTDTIDRQYCRFTGIIQQIRHVLLTQ
jgi:hypothetical protein